MPLPLGGCSRTCSQESMGNPTAFNGFSLALRKHRGKETARGAVVPAIQPHLSLLANQLLRVKVVVPPRGCCFWEHVVCKGQTWSGRGRAAGEQCLVSALTSQRQSGWGCLCCLDIMKEAGLNLPVSPRERRPLLPQQGRAFTWVSVPQTDLPP